MAHPHTSLLRRAILAAILVVALISLHSFSAQSDHTAQPYPQLRQKSSGVQEAASDSQPAVHAEHERVEQTLEKRTA